MMPHVYSTLADAPEVSKAGALQRAQRAFIAGEVGDAWRHPCYWAPFVLMGSWL